MDVVTQTPVFHLYQPLVYVDGNPKQTYRSFNKKQCFALWSTPNQSWQYVAFIHTADGWKGTSAQPGKHSINFTLEIVRNVECNPVTFKASEFTANMCILI